MLSIAVVVSVLESEVKFLPSCLALLAKQNSQPTEVIVSGPEGILNPCQQWQSALNLKPLISERATAPRELAKGINQAVAHTQAEYVLLLEANTYLAPNALQIYRHLLSPPAGLSQPQVISAYLGQHPQHLAPSLWLKNQKIYFLDRRLAGIEAGQFRLNPESKGQPHWYLKPDNLLLAGSLWNQLGGLNESLPSLEEVELDFAWRLTQTLKQQKQPLYQTFMTWAEKAHVRNPEPADFCERHPAVRFPARFAAPDLKVLGPVALALRQALLHHYLSQDAQFSDAEHQQLRNPNCQLQFTQIEYEWRLRFQYNQRTANSRPDFLIIGAQKAGTTTLSNYLQLQEFISAPYLKEIHYFDKHYEKGIDWYLSHFCFEPGQLTYEASPSYLLHPDCPERIFRFHPEIHLIAILRDPVARAFSAWNMYRRILELWPNRPDLEEKRSFEAAIREELKGQEQHHYLARGRYAEQLEHYGEYFERQNFLLLDFEELKHKPQKTLERCLSFLGLETHHTFLPERKAFNEGIYTSAFPESMRAELQAYYAETRHKLRTDWQLDFAWLQD